MELTDLRPPSELAEEDLRNDPLREYHVWWDDVQESDLEILKNCINTAKREEDIQQFLQRNPHFLVQHLVSGHGRWVIPKLKFGAEYVTDFVIGERHSFGFEWQVVELESPTKPLFNKKGDPSQSLNHAIRQIQDWRAWLTENQNYAARSPTDNSGLGLTDITGTVPGLILIGRRSPALYRHNQRRRQMGRDLNIHIHTFDHFSSVLEGRLKSLARWRAARCDT